MCCEPIFPYILVCMWVIFTYCLIKLHHSWYRGIHVIYYISGPAIKPLLGSFQFEFWRIHQLKCMFAFLCFFSVFHIWLQFMTAFLNGLHWSATVDPLLSLLPRWFLIAWRKQDGPGWKVTWGAAALFDLHGEGELSNWWKLDWSDNRCWQPS